MDKNAAGILNTCLRMHDLIQMGIEAAPPIAISTIKASGCRKYIKSLTQLELGYYPIESHVFSLEAHNLALRYSLPSEAADHRLQWLEEAADQIATLCSSLLEYPKICYHNTLFNLQMARSVQAKLDSYRSDNKLMGEGSYKDKSVLLLVDRGFDPLSPLLHELTMQAMAFDLLETADNTYTDDDKRKIVLTDEDPLFKDYRHMHIADANKNISHEVRQFGASQQRITALQKEAMALGQDSPDAGTADPLASSLTLTDMSNVLKEYRGYQTQTSNYSALIHLSQECMSSYLCNINKLCEVEQDLAMNETASGERINDLLFHVAGTLRLGISPEDRMRLIAILILCKDGLSETHLDRLLETTRLQPHRKLIFASLSLIFGAGIIRPDLPMNSTAPGFRFNSLPCLNDLPMLNDKFQRYLPSKKRRTNRVDEQSYAVSRWTPYLVDVMENVISNEQDKTIFPFLIDQTTRDLSGLGRNRPSSGGDRNSSSTTTLPTTNQFKGPSARYRPGATAATSNPGSSSSSNSPRSSNPRSSGSSSSNESAGSINDHCGPRLIVCVLGGVTWSEIRSGYEITQRCLESRLSASNRATRVGAAASTDAACLIKGGGGVGWNWEVIVGGTHIITPKGFLDDLNNMVSLYAPQFHVNKQN